METFENMFSKHFAELTDPLHEACFLLTVEGTLVNANRAGARMLEQPRQNLCGRMLFDFIADPVNRSISYLKTCAANRQQVPGSLTCKKEDGTVTGYRCVGYRVQASADTPPLVLLKCLPAAKAASKFVALNQQLEELRRVYLELKRANSGIETILDSIEAIVYVADMQTYELLFVNKYCRDQLGDIKGKICWQTIQDGQDGPCPFCTNKYLLDKAGKPGAPYIWEFQNTRNNRWYYLIDRAIEWTDGRIVRLEIATDITDRKAIEIKHQLDQKRFESLFKLSQRSWDSKSALVDFALEEAVQITASQVGYLHFIAKDEKTIELFSWSQSVFKDCSAAKDMHYPVDQAGIWADCVRLRKPVIHNDYPNNPDKKGYPEGHFPVLRHMSVPIFDNKRIVAIVGVGNKESPYDQTDVQQLSLFMGSMWSMLKQKQTDLELRTSRERWRLTFDSIKDVVTIHDLDMKIIEANQAAGALFDIAPQQLLGRYCYEVFRDEPGPCKGCPELLTKENLSVNEATIYHKTLNKFFDVSSSPLIDDKGVLQGFVHIAKDVTEQKQVEKQLRQSQKMEAMGTLAGGIAHDFNNILSPILGYAEINLATLSPDNAVAADLKQIKLAALRAKDLVKQILTFSRQSEHEKRPLEPYLVIKEALKLLRASLPTTIDIKQEISTDCGTVLADPTQLHQIIMNLCTNAFHAMRKTGGLLVVKLHTVEVDEQDIKVIGFDLQPGPYVRLEVSDSGCGMDQQTAEKVFEPYFTTRKKEEGTGLGLAVVHGIVNSYGGHISVYSEPGKGSTFHVYLPTLDKSTTDLVVKPSAQVPTGTEKILLVDDEKSITAMYRKMLTKLGYEVTVCNDSADALALFQKNPAAFDLLVTDMTMPGMTGMELVQQVFAIRPNMPVILNTGFSELLNKVQAKNIGINAFLMKPVMLKELADAVRKALVKI